jgi:hypothetical protein
LADQYQPGSSLVATEADAEALRRVRRAFVDAGKLPLTGGFVPVKSSTGDQYQLFARDTIPLEDEKGLLKLF